MTFPTHTHLGVKLGLIGRLTYGWLWTDDPEVARIHYEQDVKEGKETDHSQIPKD